MRRKLLKALAVVGLSTGNGAPSNRRRRVSAFRPAINACEARVLLSSVPGLSQPQSAQLLLATSPVHAQSVTYLNPQVLAFAKRNLGRKVGDGECATLAVEAVKSAGGV